MSNFYDSSPEMRDQTLDRGFKVKYPWKEVPKGKSFTIPDNQFKLATIRSYVIRMGYKYGKKFKVIHHMNDKLYEIGCLQEGLSIIPEGRRKAKSKPIEPAKIVNGRFEGPLPAGWGTINGSEGEK